MKAIKLRSNIINIPFEDDEGNIKLELHFDKTDENVNRMYDAFDEYEKKTKEIEEASDNSEATEKAKALLKTYVDSTFGTGSFDKLYELNPSVIIVGRYFYDICIGIKEEMELEDIKAVEEKYLN